LDESHIVVSREIGLVVCANRQAFGKMKAEAQLLGRKLPRIALVDD
jgi:hypothetical protein